MTNTTQNAVSTPAITKFEVGKCYRGTNIHWGGFDGTYKVLKRGKVYLTVTQKCSDGTFGRLIERFKIREGAGREYVSTLNGLISATDSIAVEENTPNQPVLETKIVNGKLSRYIDGKSVGSSTAMDAAAEIRQGKPVTVVAYGNRHTVRVPNLTINNVHSRYNGSSFNVKLSVNGERQLICSVRANLQRAKEIIASIENLYFAGAELIQVDTAGNVTVTENAINLHVIETRPDKNGITMRFVDGKRVGNEDVYYAVTENHRALICNEFAKLGISTATQTEQEKYGCTGTFARIELDDDFLGGYNEFSFETADEAIDAAQKIKAAFGKKFYSATICNREGFYGQTKFLAEIKPDTDLPTGTITVDSGVKAFELAAKYFPNGLKFDTLSAWHNGEEQFNFTDGDGMYLFATCDRDNTRVESLEIVDTNEDGSKRKPLFVVINQPEFSEIDAAEHAITAEAQDAAVEAEIELANTTNESESNDETAKQLPEIKPECKRFGSFKIKAAAVDAKLEAATFKPASVDENGTRELEYNILFECVLTIDEATRYADQIRNAFGEDKNCGVDVRSGLIRITRNADSEFKRFLQIVREMLQRGCHLEFDGQLIEYGDLPDEPENFQRVCDIIGKQIAKLQNVAHVEKPAPVDNTEKIEDLIDEAHEIRDDYIDTQMILECKIRQHAPKSELENLAKYLVDRQRDYDAVIAELYTLTNDKLPEKNPDDYDTEKILLSAGYHEAGKYPIDFDIYHGGDRLTREQLDEYGDKLSKAINANGNLGVVEVEDCYITVYGNAGGDNRAIWKIIGELCWQGDCGLEYVNADGEQCEMPGVEIDAMLERMGIENQPEAEHRIIHLPNGRQIAGTKSEVDESIKRLWELERSNAVQLTAIRQLLTECKKLGRRIQILLDRARKDDSLKGGETCGQIRTRYAV